MGDAKRRRDQGLPPRGDGGVRVRTPEGPPPGSVLSDDELRAALWPGTPRWLKELALNVRGTDGIVPDGDGGFCMLYSAILGAALTALDRPWQWWPCALRVQRAGLPAWDFGFEASAQDSVTDGLWSGHMMIATEGFLVDVGLPVAAIREYRMEAVWIWNQAILESRPEIQIQPRPDLHWRIAHPRPMPPLELAPLLEYVTSAGRQYAEHVRRHWNASRVVGGPIHVYALSDVAP